MTSRSSNSGRVRLAAISFSAVAALVLSGCSNGEDPQGSPNAGPSSSTSQTATPTQSATATPKPTLVYKPADAKGRAQNVPVPVKPVLADKNSKEGLEAFARYWFSLLNYGYETGDLAVWSKLTSASCVFCNNIKTSVAVGYKEGRWQAGGRLSAPSIEARYKANSTEQQVVAQVIQEITQYYKADKTVGRNPEPGTNTAVVVLATHAQGRWSVTDMHLVQ